MSAASPSATANDALALMAKAAISLATAALLLWSSASILHGLWNWFLPPLGVPRVTLPIAWGLCTLHSFLSARNYDAPAVKTKKAWSEWISQALAKAGALWISYGFGWVIHHYWMVG